VINNNAGQAGGFSIVEANLAFDAVITNTGLVYGYNYLGI
jgi:hypothetical protein